MAGRAGLCFHGIGEPRRTLEPGEARYWIGVETFRAVLDRVAAMPRTPQPVRITFDDGNVSDVETALPELTARGLKATFFVLAGRLDEPGSLSRDHVRTLVTEGMGVGSHGMDHRPWVGMDDVTRRRELVEARDHLREVTGTPIDEAALPLGRYDRRLLRQLRSLGYRHVHTSDRAWARPDAWLQPRFSLRDTDTIENVHTEMLTRPSFARRAERTAVGWVKRLR
ncbi:polysaccharide deacetylase family protein [Nocardioides sp. LS1]|uniref:polysaccharide deacetylase family protein n=1 Tax=Nocardioides sp. LS1 TaxID=1027620 RepID=UPI000F616B18|nr:polysaccharide deacetylase family protein [Nocardioides sp. LS1]